MNIEGTRHERVSIVTTAYIIGFVTAFIAFGVSQFEDTVEFVYVPEAPMTAAVAESEAEVVEATDAVLEQTPAGLVYKRGGEETLLVAVSDDATTDGLAAAVPQYELSPDGAFAYFCEQTVASVDACKPFVYSVAQKMVIPLTQKAERIAFSTTPATVVWQEAGIATIDGQPVDPLPAF